MINPYSSSVSGINAAFKMMETSAHNTANMDTDGFKRHRVRLAEGESGGVVVSISKDSEPGPKYKDQTGQMKEASNVNYAEEAVTQINAKHYAAANAAAFKTAEKMDKSIIDLFA